MVNMLSDFVLKNRKLFILLILSYTIFMAYMGQFVKFNYDFSQTVPDTDEDMIYYNSFKKTFGEDGNVFAIGLKDSSIFVLDKFINYREYIKEIESIEGINGVLGLPNLQILSKNKENKNFTFVDLMEPFPNSQMELDSLLLIVNNQKFYDNKILNKYGALTLLITIDKEILNSKDRDKLMQNLITLSANFESNSGIKLHYAGLPYSRYIMAESVKEELTRLLIISLVVTAIILFVFFRSFDTVFVPLIIIGIVVVWVFGTLSLLGYKITLLTGLLPPLIVVIGIPNCVYMLNYYHFSIKEYSNKKQAISNVIQTIGLITLITNLTTAVGFFVLATTDIKILTEFGIVAGINVLATFIVSIFLIPSIYLALPKPKSQQTGYLNYNFINVLIKSFKYISFNYQKRVFFISTVIVISSLYGLSKIKSVSYLIDDVPSESSLMKDLKFFEENFSGIMPLEIVVDTKMKKGVQNLNLLKKVDKLESFLSEKSYVSSPISLVSFVKASRQAYYNNNPSYFSLPNNRDKNFILRYIADGYQNNVSNDNISKSFVDSIGQKLRISLNVADLGSLKLDSIVNNTFRPEIDKIFGNSKAEVKLTGTTLTFIKGINFLIENLLQSMLLAFIIISVIMALLFKNLKMVIISLIPNIIPIIIAAGIMGFLGIPLKPSSALVFSIVFGISVDYSIHFLAKFKNELLENDLKNSISNTINQTGRSMIFTSFILFFGFIIFAFSNFGGTIVLGILTSVILFVAMITNLTLLPSIILHFYKK
ncbi:MAG: MMPL family transporter [Bacteroidota bacterium]|nr:MMPL family transporter [Bacteroidota bacterium]